ncbi:hypothetical protein [Hugenholtzia roseola]|uniref:hypothetical protein n=1 Tax=Hugenholtzia roseola TaxID=1002 RepID=UPI000412FF5E|nr:hypothetical protein [Hugenholtzia roseola]
MKLYANPLFYFLFFLALFALPLGGAWLSEFLFVEVSLKNEIFINLFKTGKIHYGYPYYVSLFITLPISLLLFTLLQKRFMLYDIESTNVRILLMMLICSTLMTEYSLEYLLTKKQWWYYSNYSEIVQKHSVMYLFTIPHFLNALFYFLAVQTLVYISGLNQNFRKIRLLFKKNRWKPEQFEQILDFSFEKYKNQEFYQTLKAETLQIETPYFHFSDLRKFRRLLHKKALLHDFNLEEQNL